MTKMGELGHRDIKASVTVSAIANEIFNSLLCLLWDIFELKIIVAHYVFNFSCKNSARNRTSVPSKYEKLKFSKYEKAMK